MVGGCGLTDLAGVSVGEGRSPAAGAEGLLGDGVAEEHQLRPQQRLLGSRSTYQCQKREREVTREGLEPAVVRRAG